MFSFLVDIFLNIPIYYWTPAVITALIFVVSVTYGILFQRRKKTKVFNPDEFTAAKHQFESIKAKGIYFCNVCNQLIAGFWSVNGQECIKCGMIVHQTCKYKKKIHCKKVTTTELRVNHQWLEQVDSTDYCYVCQIKCQNIIGGFSSSCMWCRRAVHHSCMDSIGNQICDYGELCDIIIKPTEIKFHKKGFTDLKYFKKNQNKIKQSFSQKLISNFQSKKLHDSSEDTETDTEYLKQGEDKWSLDLNENRRPVVVVINKKSGGQLGMDCLKKLYKLLNPIQVIDLIDEGLERLKIFRNQQKLCIIVGGGDGTVASVVNYIKSGEIKEWQQKNPPVSVLPLGTGNDLGRCLGWGGGSEGASRLVTYLKQVDQQGQKILLDRWNIQCDQECLQKQKNITMYNYFSIGLDAKTCLNFHKLRERQPGLFVSRVGNKFIYSQIGAADIILGRKVDFSQLCEILVDGKKVDIPEGIQNLVFLNITSWAGGATNLWYSESEQFKKQSLMDGVIEIIGITSILHLGKVQTNIDKPIQIAQGSEVELIVKQDIYKQAFQIDGEPFELKTPVKFKITLQDQAVMMTHKHQKSLQFDAQILDVLNWATTNGHIDESQKSILLNKFLNK
ncbi:hypothetical protein ABPG72_009190 [Tetrahymena utriculariae]